MGDDGEQITSVTITSLDKDTMMPVPDMFIDNIKQIRLGVIFENIGEPPEPPPPNPDPVPEPHSIAIWTLMGLVLCLFGYRLRQRKR